MTTYIVYHQVRRGLDCPDGISAAWVAKKANPSAELFGCVYGEELSFTPQSGDRLLIVDFSFSAQQIESWICQGVSVVVIDHHKTAQDELSRFFIESFQDALNAKAHDDWNITFDMQESGATLAWKYFFPDKYNQMPVFLEYVKDRDLWNFDLPKTEEVHEAMAKIGRTFDLFDRLVQMNREEFLACLAPIGEVLLLPKKRAIAAACERVQHGQVAGYDNIPHVDLTPQEDRLTSDICSQLYKEFPDAPFVACFTSDGSWSLRSDKKGKNTDVGAIATAFGGGGHHNAAGFRGSAYPLP